MTTTTGRDQLILSVDGIVKRIAREFAQRSGVDYEDLVSDGYLGAIDAADRFDEARGLRFSTFASHRIRGAILDGLRDRDHLSRAQRRAAGVDDVRVAAPISLQTPIASPGGHREDVVLGDIIPSTDDAFDDTLADAEAARWALDQLTGDERDLVELLYWREMPLEDIGALYGVTESRACQIHVQALHHLRVAFLRAGFDLVQVTERVVDVAKRKRSMLTAAEHGAVFGGLLDFWGSE